MALIGAAIGWVWDSILFGMFLTLIAASVYALIAYIQGRTMLTRMTGARPLTKQEYPHAYHAIEGLSMAAGIPTPKMYVIDAPALNAFATGRNPDDGAVVLTTGIIQKLNREELEGVIAHELAHIKNYDIRVMMIAAVITGVILFLSQFLLRSFLFSNNRNSNRDGRMQAIGILLAIVLAILSPIISEMIRLGISRKREYAADAGAATFTRNPRGLANALRKISGDTQAEVLANAATNHLYISNPSKKKSFWKNAFSTHPPTEERIKRLEQM